MVAVIKREKEQPELFSQQDGRPSTDLTASGRKTKERKNLQKSGKLLPGKARRERAREKVNDLRVDFSYSQSQEMGLGVCRFH